MEMSYNGTLVMPNSFALIQEDEMEYIEGGITRSQALAFVTGALVTIVGGIAKKAVSKSLIGAAMSAASSWVAGVIDTVIIAIYVHPFIAAAIALAGVACIGGAIYAIGKNKKWW